MANDKSWVWDHFERRDQKTGNNKTYFQAWCNYCITNVIKNSSRRREYQIKPACNQGTCAFRVKRKFGMPEKITSKDKAGSRIDDEVQSETEGEGSDRLGVGG